jgi:hypothetical protein
VFSLTNPWIALLLLAALVGAYLKGDRDGFKQCDLENQVQVAKMNAQARAVEEAHQNALNALGQQLKAANDAAKTTNATLRSAAADSGYRVRVTETGCVQATADTGTPSGDQPEPTAKLDPAVGDALFEIAGTGDEAIRSLNACIAAYDKVRGNQ